MKNKNIFKSNFFLILGQVVDKQNGIFSFSLTFMQFYSHLFIQLFKATK